MGASSGKRNDLVVEHLPLVRAIAVHLRRKLPECVDLDDLIQAGTLGLLDAVNKFDSAKAGTFGTYAKHRIRGAILDSLRQSDWASRETRRNHRRVEEAMHELSVALQRAPTEAELAAKLGMSLERWRRMMVTLRTGFISTASRSTDPENLTPMNFPDKAENQPESLYARNQLREMLASAMETLSERERTTLFLYYDNEISLNQISQTLGVHESRASQIHRGAVQKIAKVFQSAGIDSSRAFSAC
jgi:RNA polymerase sigma factor for flagellar operon FliA